jgi:predicted alpha/beta-hydrolase family hydrolase
VSPWFAVVTTSIRLQNMDLSIETGTKSGAVSGILNLPGDADALLVFAHGAGAGMRHNFMMTMADLLAERRIGTLRYQFPYMEAGRGQPDRPATLEATVVAAVTEAGRRAPGLPLFAGGKSMGGRMTSGAQAKVPLPGVRGLVFFGFPLHPPKNPGTSRAEHLSQVTVPMLFIQGTRDSLADLDLIRGVIGGLGGKAAIHVVEEGDHSFHVPKRSGKTDPQVLAELADVVRNWDSSILLD